MQSCLGLYIDENIIKYAKVSKEKEDIKIDSFGVKFYENLDKAIKQIIEETYSYKVPISTNLKGENYSFFNMFSLLNKKDLQKAIDIEFETYCSEKGQNANAFETRYAAVSNIEDKEKVKIIFINDSKNDINNTKQKLEGYRLTNMVPLSMCISNIIKTNPRENSLIVNIEEKTTVTTILDQKIYDIAKFEEGSKAILDNINARENSYAKAYEICKNTTIYTSEAQDYIGEESTAYLENIMPTLYNIVGKIQKIINESTQRIDKIYLTGTLANVNNIDLYFQEYLGNVQCEILKPYFINNISKEVNIKDYIEINSALALALQGLGVGIEGINFKKPSLKDKMPEISTKSNKKAPKPTKEKTNSKIDISFDSLKGSITKGEKVLIRTAASVAVFMMIYGVFASILTNQMNGISTKIDERKVQINSEIRKVETDITSLNKQASQYSTLITQLETAGKKISDINRSKNSIPNLLNKIMFTIPDKVQITSIQNTTGSRIVIHAQAASYDELGYFKAKIKTDNILTNVVSSSGIKQDGIVKVTIEGDLP